jgi:hypothetical protein
MTIARIAASTTLISLLLSLGPAGPALANGAASTRNILLGIGAATYLIIHHNRQVHEKYAEDARRQAEIARERDDAWAAYRAEERAYENEVALVNDYKREVAYQHAIIERQRRQLAELGIHTSTTLARTGTAHGRSAPARDVAVVSYGWGTL